MKDNLFMGYKYETHMHTSEVSACGRLPAKSQVQAYKKKGYTGIIMTDHFINGLTTCPHYLSWEEKMVFIMSGYEAAKKEGDKCNLDVFFGWEFTIRGSDFLTYGLDLDFLLAYPGLDKFPIDKYSDVVRDNGGFLAQAHPFKDDYYIEYKFPVDCKYVDAIEVHNSNIPNSTNKKAMEFAIANNLPMQAGTDSHGRSGMFPSGVELQEKAESIFDIFNAIKARNVTLMLPKT